MSNESRSQSFLVEVNDQFVTTPSPAREPGNHDKKLAVTSGDRNDAAVIDLLDDFLCTGSKPKVLFLGRLIDEPPNSKSSAMYWTVRSDMLQPYQSDGTSNSLVMGSDSMLHYSYVQHSSSPPCETAWLTIVQTLDCVQMRDILG